MKLSIRDRLILFLLFSLPLTTANVAAGDFALPNGIRLEVVSVKVLSEGQHLKRCAHTPGQGTCVAVRMRLSSSDERGIYFYTYHDWAIPRGYRVKLSDGRIEWFWGNAGTATKKSSPGLDALLQGAPSRWVLLPANSVIEWEETDTTLFSGEKHAYTMFIRTGPDEKYKEVVSTSYLVPGFPLRM